MENKSPFFAAVLAITLIAGYFFYDDKITKLEAEVSDIANEYNEKTVEVKSDVITTDSANILEDLNNQLIKVRSELQITQEKLSLATGKTSVLGDEMSQMHDARGKVKSLNTSLEGTEQALNLSDKKLIQLKNIFEKQNKANIQNNLQRIYDLEDTTKGIAITGLILPVVGIATLFAYKNKETKNYCKNIQNTIDLEKKVFGRAVSINDEMKQLYQTQCIDKQQETGK
ncbi:MAG: hypothetical protein DSZ20_05825 [Candidatus Thioglobus sp.]|nr:MAG: hypothetical protein DSZ20_05825 [Candidatus Thioglobus sp.]